MARNNVFIPSEGWNKAYWFMIEFAIVFAVGLVIGWATSPLYEPLVTEQQLECHQISHEVECDLAEEPTVNQSSLNWIFWGTAGGIVLAWYIVIRGFAIKKPVLGN